MQIMKVGRSCADARTPPESPERPASDCAPYHSRNKANSTYCSTSG